MRTVSLPDGAERATTVVIGIESGWQYAEDGSRHRTVYAYWHGKGLPERTEWLHDPVEGSVLWTVGKVADAVLKTAPETRMLFSSSVHFPNEGTEDEGKDEA